MTFYSGGYFIVKPAERAEVMNAEILPSLILSASACICDTYPDEGGEVHKRDFDDENTYKNAQDWVWENLEKKNGWPNVFFRLETAIEFYQLFLSHLKGLKLIGIGLTQRYVKEFIMESLDCNETDVGVFQCLSQKQLLHNDGKILGYEVLGYCTNLFHSYICNGMESEYTNLGIKLNSEGFISTLQQAEQAAKLITEDDGVETDLYLPWVIKEYKLECE